MSSWERPRPPHLDSQNNLEINKPVQSRGSYHNERASAGSGSVGTTSAHRLVASSSCSAYSTSKNGFSAGSTALPPRPSSGLYPPAPSAPLPGKGRYMPSGALDTRASQSLAIPFSSSQSGSRDTYRENATSNGSSHRRRESQISLLDDRDAFPSRPLISPPRMSMSSTQANRKKPRKPPAYVPSFIPTFDDIEGTMPAAPVASGSTTSIITELAQNDIDRMNAQYDARSPPSSSYTRSRPSPSIPNGHPTSSRYTQPPPGASSSSWASGTGLSPLGRPADLPRRPSVDYDPRKRSVSRDSRSRNDHWSPPRRRHNESMERSLSRDGYRRQRSPRRFDRSPSRDRRSDHWRGDSPSPPPRRQYSGDSVDSRGYPYRSRSISRSPVRQRIHADDNQYDWSRRRDDLEYSEGRSWEEDRRYDSEFRDKRNGYPRRSRRGREDHWSDSRSRSRSRTRRRNSIRHSDERPSTPDGADLPTTPPPPPAVLDPPQEREPVKISFGAKPKVAMTNGLTEKPPDFHFRRDLETSRRKYEPNNQEASVPLHDSNRVQLPEPERIPSPPPIYIPPPPPSIVKQEIGRGNFRIVNHTSKDKYRREDGFPREGEDEVIVEDPRLAMTKEKILAGSGARENRIDGLVEVPRYAWNTQSSGPPPANAICIAGLSHLTTQSDIALRIGGLAKQFKYSDHKVTGQAKIADIDILLNKITGASSGLCRVTFRGEYPLEANERVNRDSTKRKTWQADVKAGEVTAANKFAQHVVRTLNNTRIGPSYKVPNERVRVVLDGQKAKINQLYKLVLAGKPPILPDEQRKRDLSDLPTERSAETTPAPVKPTQAVSTPTPIAPQHTPLVPQTPASLVGGATPAIGGNTSSYIPLVPPPIIAQPRSVPNTFQQAGGYSYNQMQHRYSGGAKYAHMPYHPLHNIASVPASNVPQEPKYHTGQYGPFHPLNPHATTNRLLRKHYEDQVRDYEEKKARLSRQVRPPVSRDSFVDIPFHHDARQEDYQDRSWRSGDRHARGADLKQADASTEVSSDAEAEESDTDRDVIIDPKKRHERHRGQAKTVTTPVKATAAARPSVKPVALGCDKVGMLLLENGFPYIFVPMVSEIQWKEPLRQLKQYFKGCQDVLADSSGYYVLFNSAFRARPCLDLVKMKEFPLGTIRPEFREAKNVEPAVPTGLITPERRGKKVDVLESQTESSVQSSLPPVATISVETSAEISAETDVKPSSISRSAKPQPKQRKKTVRRVASESPTPKVDVDMALDIEPSASVDPAGEASPGPAIEVQPADVDVCSEERPVTIDPIGIDEQIEKLIEPEAETEMVAVPTSQFVETTVNQKLEEVEDLQVLALAEVPVSVAPPKKGGKRKTIAKEDKQQPPKKKAKKGKAARLVEDPVDVPIDIAGDVDMDAPTKPVKPSELDPMKNGLAQDEEDLFLLRLVVEAKATGEVPLLPEEKALLEEESIMEGVVETAGESEEQDGYIHPSGCARSHGYYKVSALDKSAYLPQRNRAIVEVDNPAGATGASGNNNAVASSRSARVATRRFVQGMEQSKKAADADSDVFAFNQLRTRKKQLKFQRSPIHDWGLYAAESITAGEMVIEYVGEVIRAQVADIREKWYEKIGIGSSYLFRVDDDAVVDATKKGSMARLINHCCTPNCTAKIITINGEKKIVIYAKTNILPGDEITYDYHFPIESPENKVICLCGSARCRGFLN